LELAQPLSSAKYLRMETFLDPAVAPGQRQTWYPWPYVEGLTIAEAGNELAFLVTGAYGKPVSKQQGAPLRLAVPWKYGFKSIKSIVRFNFTDQRPKSYWEALQASEYGFWANQPAGAASALESGDRGADRIERAPPHAPVQRLWRTCRRSLQRPGEGAAVDIAQRGKWRIAQGRIASGELRVANSEWRRAGMSIRYSLFAFHVLRRLASTRTLIQ
jgi:hypothetical protein